jgi:hypothetical protein
VGMEVLAEVRYETFKEMTTDVCFDDLHKHHIHKYQKGQSFHARYLVRITGSVLFENISSMLNATQKYFHFVPDFHFRC